MKLRYHRNCYILRNVRNKRHCERCFLEVINVNDIIYFIEKKFKVVAITSICFPLNVIEFEVEEVKGEK